VIDPEQRERIDRALPILQQAPRELAEEFWRRAFLVRIPAGRDVFLQGDRIEAIPLLLSGTVRVYQIGESGREVTLYRFRKGESCVLTANSILSQQSFPAIASVEQEAEAVMIPAETFREWVGRHAIWRDFFIGLVSQRLASVMAIVDEVAFRRLDTRVAGLLLQKAQAANPVRTTHQTIAAELGSSREVISRVLEDLGSRGLIRASRGAVEVLDLGGLRRFAER
jgi:CRP/FNR family transcriptional regulator